MEDGISKGLAVQESVERLKRIRWALKRLYSVFIAKIASEPVYEFKMAFSLHAHYCGEHIDALERRIRQLDQTERGELAETSLADGLVCTTIYEAVIESWKT
jgi:hypothetical protein